MSTLDKAPQFTMPDDAWEDWTIDGELGEIGSRLGATAVMNGVYFHVEAIEVAVSDSGLQEAASPYWEETFAQYFEACGADGHVGIVTIKGRKYAVFFSPFC